ncbi:MAG: PaaI family thioesterase, partial [Firmicutes bacterium]|nr:PaaI family thioesterase [Bacillota bacterium]
VPLEQTIVAVGRVTRNRSRMFEGSGEIYLPDGTLLASAEGRYMKLPVDKIVESETPISDMNWRMLDVENAPEYIELPY